MADGKTSGRSLGVDVLRGIAVMAVVLCHAPFSALSFGQGSGAGAGVFPPAPLPHLLHYGEYGVHLFLVISGFCIHMKWAKAADVTRGVDFVPFWKRRLVRLYPPYIVTLVAALALTYVYNAVVLGQTESLAARFGYAQTSTFVIDILLLLLLAQNLTQASWKVNNGPYWSLALEEQLYMLYFPGLHLRRRYGWTVTLAVAAAVTLAWRASGNLAFGDEVPKFWGIVGPALWLPWMLGAWSAEIHCGHGKNPLGAGAWGGLGVAAFALAGFVVEPLAELGRSWAIFEWVVTDLVFSMGCFALVMAVTTRERDAPETFGGLFWQGLARIGIWSYSIYLTHMLIIVPVKHALVRFGVPAPAIFAMRVAIPVVFAFFFYKFVELPAHRLARRVSPRS